MPDADAVATLKATCDTAYDLYGTSCSHAVWAVIRGVYSPSETYRQANELIEYLITNWKEVDLDTGLALANKGTIVVGGLKADPNGHVIVIYPGEKKFNGGYEYYYAKQKKNLILKGTAKYPLCLSTSKGSWPGAKSKGDKTVWDPWGKDTAFAKVKFWTPKG